MNKVFNDILTLGSAAQLNAIAQKAFPYRNVIDEGVLLSNFEDLTLWTASGNGTLTADTVNKVTGTQGCKMTVTTVGSYVAGMAEISVDKIKTVSLKIHVVDAATQRPTITIRFSPTTAMTPSFYYNIGYGTYTEGWNYIKIPVEDFATSNGAVWGSMTAIKIYLQAQAGQVAEVTIDDLLINEKSRAKVILGFSGGYYSVYDKAYPIMKKYGFPGVLYVRPPWLETGNPTYVSIAQAQEMQNLSNWDMAQHSYAGISYVTSTDEEIIEDLTLCKQWQVNNGLESAADFVMRASLNPHAAEVLSGTFVKAASCMRTSGGAVKTENQPIVAPLMWLINSVMTFDPTTTFATDIKPKIDATIARGGLFAPYMHGVADSPVEFEIGTTEFEAFMAYLALNVSLGKLDVVNFSGWYDEYHLTEIPDKPFKWGTPNFQEYRGYATTDIGSIAAGAIATFTITVNGANIGDTILLGPPAAIEAGLTWSGYVSAANTVTVRVHNTTGDAIDPASATWKAMVLS